MAKIAHFAGILPAATLAAGLVPTTAAAPQDWQIGAPIVTYWAGPELTDAVARQMAEGGWNLVWCSEKTLDVAQRHGLRALLQDGLLSVATLRDPEKKAQLDALIARVKDHPALYAYFLGDEPNASAFPALGNLVAYLRARDPAHLAYLNLFPTYASNEQLGNQGDVVTAYQAHLRQYVGIVQPALISYDHYHFTSNGDGDQYFLNLGLIRQAALAAGVPFLNIVQACSWTPSMRVPNGDELRWLTYTSLAYGAQGISHYVYCWPGHTGMIANPDGTPTERYHAAKVHNRDFAAIAAQLQPLRSLGAYHLGNIPEGAQALPADFPFTLDPPVPTVAYEPPKPIQGFCLGTFGPAGRAGQPGKPTHVVVVNLDYRQGTTTTLVGPGPLDVFDPTTGEWTRASGRRAELRLPPGGGALVRLRPRR
ncbi:MAG: hypothetical protein GX774_16830 [Armatimonadetes bacterium]|jgi:hypothetical protein|nr:hypothetical protein [Armatimonadota bacterium]